MDIKESLETLKEQGAFTGKRLILWGIGHNTEQVLVWLRQKGMTAAYIVDNFKCTFYKEYEGLTVHDAAYLDCEADKDGLAVLLAVNFADAIRRQLGAMGVHTIYNLLNLQEKKAERCEVEYRFQDRSRGMETLCYVMAGYEPLLYDNVLGRIRKHSCPDMDYCLISSGIYSQELDGIAARYGWSYLSTAQNQVCFIQNKVIELHPKARYIFKLDEDIFIGAGYFENMLKAYRRLEEEGEYRIGFLVPVIPVNCFGYRSFLNAVGKTKAYEQKFGRAYRSRFSAVFSLSQVAEYLWKETGSFDQRAKWFAEERDGFTVCDCYFNIGAMLYDRQRWSMMGRWPEKPGTGMGMDESFILRDNAEKDFAVYEIGNVLAGHFAFGHQKERMREFYREHPEIFQML